MIKVTALAKRGEVAVVVVRGVLVEMGTGKLDDRRAKEARVGELRGIWQAVANETAASIAPAAAILVKPTAIPRCMTVLP